MGGPLAVKLNSFRIHRAKLKAVQTWLNGRSLKSPPPTPPPHVQCKLPNYSGLMTDVTASVVGITRFSKPFL